MRKIYETGQFVYRYKIITIKNATFKIDFAIKFKNMGQLE